MKKSDGDKTKLSSKTRFGKKAKSIAAALTLAAGTMGLAACGESPSSNSGWEQSNERVPADISRMSAAERNGTLVQGREACIDRMVQSGQARAEASTTCDEISRQAQQMVQQNPQQYNSSGSTFNNALLWYMIGSHMGSSSRPVVYYGNPSGNLTQASGIRSGTAARTITPLQSEYLRSAPASRPGLAARMATRPGVNVVSVPVTAGARITPPPPPPRATSSGGMSSRGIGTGG